VQYTTRQPYAKVCHENLRTALLATAIAILLPHASQAQEHGSVSGFTGFTVAQSSPISTLASVSSGVGSN
jgi:hypothetical protein